MSPIILHCCCGPCASSSIEKLIDEGKKPILFFSNSNIDTKEEFNIRLQNLQTVADFFKTPVFIDPYKHQEWLQAVSGFEQSLEGGDRCRICFRYNLSRTAQFLNNRDEKEFSTTLSVSPHKRSETLFEIGNSFEGFSSYNFKKGGGFQRSNEISRELGLYRQKYCGCEFSKKESRDKITEKEKKK